MGTLARYFTYRNCGLFSLSLPFFRESGRGTLVRYFTYNNCDLFGFLWRIGEEDIGKVLYLLPRCEPTEEGDVYKVVYGVAVWLDTGCVLASLQGVYLLDIRILPGSLQRVYLLDIRMLQGSLQCIYRLLDVYKAVYSVLTYTSY